MKTILVPTDFSSYANNALDFAYQIAKKVDAQIRLVHIIESLDAQMYNSMGMADVNSQANMYMGLMVKGVHKQMENTIHAHCQCNVWPGIGWHRTGHDRLLYWLT